MANRKPNLLVVAHPDDESIFFGGLVQQERSHPWHLICVTDGNGDGRAEQRHKELLQAAKLLKIHSREQWDFKDQYERRLDLDRLAHLLAPWVHKAGAVYTHGPIGEYGHPHHQDVAYVAHQVFSHRLPVWGTSYNCRPQKRIVLTLRQFELKAKILNSVYRLETERFVHLLPILSEEGFCRFSKAEAQTVYRALRSGAKLNPRHLKHYRWMGSILPQSAYGRLNRPF